MDAANKKYYEDIMADFNKYRHGRNLYQFCRDERIDYKWFLSLQRQYNYEKSHPEVKSEESLTKDDFFEVSKVEDTDGKSLVAEEGNRPWKIERLVISTPEGHQVELRSDTVESVVRILTKVCGSHV